MENLQTACATDVSFNMPREAAEFAKVISTHFMGELAEHNAAVRTAKLSKGRGDFGIA